MANRTLHVTLGIIITMIYLPFDFIYVNGSYGMLLRDAWIYWVVAILLGLIGAEGPDFDQLYGFMSHRDIISHSILFPGAIFAMAMIWRITVENNPIITAFIPFIMAYGLHLFIDIFPNIRIRDIPNKKIRISEKKGTYLMHLPFIYKNLKGKERHTLGVHQTEFWLIVNAILCSTMSLLISLARYYTSI